MHVFAHRILARGYGVLEREARANRVYRDFTRVGDEKPVAHVLEHQQTQHHLGRSAQPARLWLCGCRLDGAS